MARSRVDAGVTARAKKYKDTEGGTAGYCCCSGWEYKTQNREKERACMFANQCEFLYLPACLWTLHLLGICVAEKRVLTLFTRRGDGCLPSIAALLLSSGHVYESQITRSELHWVRAHRNWLYSCLDVSEEVSDVTQNPYPASLKSNLREAQRRRRSLCLGSFVSLWHVLPCLLDTCQRLKESRHRERER